MLQCICLKLHNVQESKRVKEDAGEGAGLGGPGSPQSLQEAGNAWAGMNAGTAGAAGMAGASVTTLRGLVAAQQEQDTSDGLG